jgi:3-oxoadipate enol-lactonase
MPHVRLADGLNMAYDIHDAGASDGLPVLMVMGFGLPGRVWRYIVPELAPERRVITFDNRGAGKTDATAGGYRMRQLAADAMHLLDHLGIERVHLVGVSMGGMVSQEIALEHRARIASLSLLATHPGGMVNRLPRAAGAWHFLSANFARSRPDRLRAVSRLLFPRAFREQVGERWLMDVLSEDFAEPPSLTGRRGQLAAVFHHDTRARLARLAGLPTLIVKPEADLLVNPRNSEVLHEAIPGSTIVRYADAGHGLIRQKGPELGQALRAHFGTAEVAPRTAAAP